NLLPAGLNHTGVAPFGSSARIRFDQSSCSSNKPKLPGLLFRNRICHREGRNMRVLMLILIVVAAMIVSAQSPPPSDVAGLKIIRVELQHRPVKGPTLRAVASTDPGSQSQARNDRGQDSNSDSRPALHRISQNAEIAPNTSKQDPLGNMASPTPVIFIASIV